MRDRKVLVVSHDASRTGAPKVAVDVLRALESHGTSCVAVLRWGGPLEAEFRAAADRVLLEPGRRTRVALRKHRRTRRLAVALEQAAALVVLLRVRPRLVYLNTVKSACYVRPAVLLGLPVVLHCHELEPLASRTLGRYRLRPLYARLRLAACSAAARDNLARVTGVPPERIAVIDSSVDADRVTALAEEASPVPLDGAAVVGACGTTDKRKGVDLWCEVARLVSAGRAPGSVRFVWVGGADGSAATVDGAPVEFVGHRENPYPWLRSFDIFTLPSRTDAAPLVVLEAMALGRPVVAFDVGGVAAQVGRTGRLVPREDVREMARAIAELIDDPGARARLGADAAVRAREAFGMHRFAEVVRELVSDAAR